MSDPASDTTNEGHARREIAVLLSRFPLITETFILREVIEMERQGQPVRLVPMIRESPAVVHPEAIPWVERALFTPWVSGAIALANLRAFLRRPLFYSRTALELLGGMLRSADFLLRTVALFPKSVYLAERLEKEGIRHVHAHYATHPATMAMIIARFAPSITFSFTAHAHDIFVNRVMLAPKLARAAGVRAISRFNRTYLAALYPAIPAEKIGVIRVGIDPGAYRNENRPDDLPLRILCVAALKPYKGIHVLIEACRLLQERGVDFLCEIVGDGPLRRHVEAQIARCGVSRRVVLLGARPQEEVAALIKRSAIFALPSVIAHDNQMEGIPVALMEAMAASRPVVASALSGIPELVENDVTGLLVDANNPEILASALQRLANDPGLRRRLGEAGRRKVEEDFDLRTNVGALLAWIDGMNPPADLDVPALRRKGKGVGVREVCSTGDSRVARILIAGDARPIEAILKEHRVRDGESAPPAVRASREAEILSELHRRSDPGDLALTVPEPIAVEGSAVVMRVAPGVRLDDLLRRMRFGADDASLESAVAGAGKWLRWFHRQRGLDGAEGALVHGDYWPGNVFIDDGTVSVVDFEGARPGDPVDDVGYFLVHMELFFPPPLRGRFRRLRRIFLQSHFEGALPDSGDVERAEAAVARALSRRLETSGARTRLQRFVLAHHRRPGVA